MTKLSPKNHLYNVLIAVVLTAVAIPFHPGIPWFAWAGACAVMFISAELFSRVFAPADPEAPKHHKRRPLYIAAVAAAALALSAAGYLLCSRG
ncbi:hypothetical protein [Leucobacter aridicollis]|uniref:hypothetical protein n=1 Tax=Leucobacter aridicollis TaxID=283878 RepID=UPI0021680E28|nr:hypothetical protein [Leucobacter aridicollis]MCS3427017.1 hypothetical protein [Leucobacter aridicollis]